MPATGLILKRARKGRGEEQSVLTDVLPDRGLDVATSPGGRRSAQIMEETRGSGRNRLGLEPKALALKIKIAGFYKCSLLQGCPQYLLQDCEVSAFH